LAYESNPALWGIGFVTAGITAFYMFRMYLMTFEGEFRGTNALVIGVIDYEQGKTGHDDHGHEAHMPHESPISMTLPLMVLAVPSMLIGLLGTPFHNYFEEFIHAPGEMFHLEPVDLPEFLIMGGSSVGVGLIGITLAIMMYLQKKIDPTAIAKKVPVLYNWSKNKWYFDEFYDKVFVQSSRGIARQVLEVDSKVVDGAVNLAGLATLLSGEGLKYLENGRAQFYALIVFGAVLGLVIFSGIS
jgi:NAD(P)H-quinone oxidoreductase subunit 5